MVQLSSAGIYWLLAAAACLAVTEELPECLPQSVCGYVQLNLAGINAEALCRCSNAECPLVWDPLDGRTISHGNDQYKYCERAPSLSVCSTDDVVYSTYVELSFAATGKLVNTVRVHCLCPPTHIFAQNHTKFHQYNNGVTSMAVTSLCKPDILNVSGIPVAAFAASAVRPDRDRRLHGHLGVLRDGVHLPEARLRLPRGTLLPQRCPLGGGPSGTAQGSLLPHQLRLRSLSPKITLSPSPRVEVLPGKHKKCHKALHLLFSGRQTGSRKLKTRTESNFQFVPIILVHKIRQMGAQSHKPLRS